MAGKQRFATVEDALVYLDKRKIKIDGRIIQLKKPELASCKLWGVFDFLRANRYMVRTHGSREE